MDSRSLSMVGNRWVSSAVRGKVVGSVLVQRVPVWVESQVFPFGLNVAVRLAMVEVRFVVLLRDVLHC